jgi:integrase/recombinase XerD
MRYIIDGDLVLSRPPTGPLAAHISAFAHWGREQGYARYSRYRRILLATCFSAWLGRRAMRRGRVLSDDASRYLQARARRVRLHNDDAPALKQFVRFLRGQGAIPPSRYRHAKSRRWTT